MPLPLSCVLVRPVTRIQAQRPSISIAVVSANFGQLKALLANAVDPARPRAPGATLASGESCRNCAE